MTAQEIREKILDVVGQNGGHLSSSLGAVEIAALSGYAFAVEPPVCKERSVEKQMEYWTLLKQNYKLVDREEVFGQNATTLLVLKRK